MDVFLPEKSHFLPAKEHGGLKRRSRVQKLTLVEPYQAKAGKLRAKVYHLPFHRAADRDLWALVRHIQLTHGDHGR
jgi:hypothetical protein